MAGSPYLFIASMDVDREHEKLFNDVYDTEHVPELLAVPGVRSALRYRKAPFSMMIGGQLRTIDLSGEPENSVVYELDDPAVLRSDAWSAAVERGRWPAEVRPYTSNRRHILLRRL